MGNQEEQKYFNSKALIEVEDAIAHLGRASDYIQDFGNISFNYRFLKAFMPEGKDEWEMDTVHDILLGLENITDEIAEQLTEIFGKTKEHWLSCNL